MYTQYTTITHVTSHEYFHAAVVTARSLNDHAFSLLLAEYAGPLPHLPVGHKGVHL